MKQRTKKARSLTTSIRMSETEHAHLKAFTERAGVTLSALFKTSVRLALGVPTREEANIRQFDNIQRQLYGAAHNLNQITRAANAGRFKMGGHAEAVIADLAAEVRRTHELFVDFRRAAHSRDLVEALEISKGLDDRVTRDV
ncbi:plasmid mobilization relaxosome protein MobC [Pelagibius sp. Alg239-R121]|uniref:plasmid mobilization protein n=1 Tax=Pelagibius sp. Alg239-R121 TaxID=2993448 RepID=UPI0024A63E60|nr:plasmid mobilization relaxosome protein MobC [Pelagibius sp. Alg239-R121]